ncbi:glycosyltransferase family 2 protein [Candidatus Uhrbacteria bacterium]|nr:glycosyltransferase family 2 protein [Candidatus Uhrbacteria bacterium]
MRVVVIIPAYNEERTVGEVVRSVREHIPDVFVVDDGSSDGTGDRARNVGAMVVRHCVNRGLGAALGTGIAAALRADADAIVTLDADGQHDPAEIATLIAPIHAGFADMVIGTRFQSPCHCEPQRSNPGHCPHGAPWTRRAFNRIANLLTRLLFNVHCSDTQSGFRCFSRLAASRIAIRTNRMEVSSEILAEAVRHDLRITEVPIRTIYTDYSLSKGQGVGEGVRTAWSLLLRRWL